MAYTDLDGCEQAANGAEHLHQVADFTGDQAAYEARIADAIDEADALINSYVRRAGREVPIEPPVPIVIQRMSARIAVYLILAHKPGGLTEQDQTMHEGRIAWLRDLVAGKVDLGVNPAPAASARNRPAASERPTTKAVSRKKFRGYT